MGKRSKKNKVILAPPLLPDVDDEDIVISQEEVDFVVNYREHSH
jgi:nucleolar complex protein 3